MPVTRERAEELLTSSGLEDHVIDHSRTVARLARRVAEALSGRGRPLDVALVETGALLHDIGRSRSHGIDHCLEGYRMLRDEDETIARIALVHIGAGIDRKEASTVGLPSHDYLPETLEERVVAFADNLVFGVRVGTPGEAEARFVRELGPDHTATHRVRRLNAWFLDALGPERPWGTA